MPNPKQDGPKPGVQKLAVVLFNLGGPDSPDAIKPFLFNLFNDKAIISAPAPIRWLLAKWISFKRAPVAKKIYAEMGGRSPILEQTQAQAQALQDVLKTSPKINMAETEAQVFVSMRYWHPFAFETARAVKKFNPDKILLLPLYPQYSTTTSASSLDEWKSVAGSIGISAPTQSICCWPTEPGFIAAEAKLLNEAVAVATATATPDTPVEVLFSAHGLPKRTVERTGDPYPEQVMAGAKEIVNVAGKLAPGNAGKFSWKVSYQSRVGPLEWIGPDTEDEIKRAGKRKAALIVIPLSFVSEHSETLVELDIEYKAVAKKAGVKNYTRVAAVGTHPDFINGLASLVGFGLHAKCNPLPGAGCANRCQPKAQSKTKSKTKSGARPKPMACPAAVAE